MNRNIILLLCGAVLLSYSCDGKKRDATVEAATAKMVDVTTAKSVVKQVSAAFDETGTFVADEASDIAPPVAGRIFVLPLMSAHL